MGKRKPRLKRGFFVCCAESVENSNRNAELAADQHDDVEDAMSEAGCFIGGKPEPELFLNTPAQFGAVVAAANLAIGLKLQIPTQ